MGSNDEPEHSLNRLGLDISCRIVVQRHEGNLSLESEPGNTRFLVRLPLRMATKDP